MNINISDCEKGYTTIEDCSRHFYENDNDDKCNECKNFIYENGIASCKYLLKMGKEK